MAKKQTPPEKAIDYDNITEATNSLLATYNELSTAFPGDSLTTAERRRLQGAGTKRYGFIDRTMDYAEEYSQFVPLQVFNLARFKRAKLDIEQFRDAQVAAEMVLRLINDQLLIAGEEAYNYALMYYNSIRELSKRNVPGTRELYENLRSLFMSRPNAVDAPETEEELLRDARKLIEGKADGEMIIKNIKPHAEGGVHEVVGKIGGGHAEKEIKIENK